MALAEKDDFGSSLPMSRIQVHDPGDRTLDGIFRLISVAERYQSQTDVLNAMCVDVAAIAGADVASIYVRERGPGGERFTMGGNVGFPADAVGSVHLKPGEGITGFVADRLRPVSVAIADRDEHFKYIPGLGEERFPALLAVPVLRAGSAAGVLVLQRREASEFSAAEVVLASALAAVINHALERCAEREQQRAREAHRRAARLRGLALSTGAAMGRAEVPPTLVALARGGTGAAAAPARADVDVDAVLEELHGNLRAARKAVHGAAARELASLALILEDRRLRSRLLQACAAAAPLEALSSLAREYARAPFRGAGVSDDATTELMGERAAEIEDLCVLVHAALFSDRPRAHSGSIVVAERLRIFSTVAAIARGASAFVVDGEVDTDSCAAALVRAAGLPLLASVTGVFSWIRPDDLLVVDADTVGEVGTVRVNPPATAVARFRRARR
jgi:phosphotransferase system enzyme I (PtsP)